MSLGLLSALLAGAAVSAATLASRGLGRGARARGRFDARLAALRVERAVTVAAPSGVGKEERFSGSPVFHVLLASIPGTSALARALRGAGLGLGVGPVLAVALSLAAFAGGAAMLSGASPFVTSLCALPAAALPLAFIAFRRARRLSTFSGQLPDALELLVRSLRAGSALTAGMRLVADEMRPPLSREFALVQEEVKLGRDLADSLEGLRARVDTPDVRLLCTSLVIQRETGGNLVEILEGLAALIRRRIAFVDKLSALTAEGRLSALILVALPPAMVGLLFLLNRPYARMLLEPGPLRAVLVAAALLQLAGALWIRGIVTVRY